MKDPERLFLAIGEADPALVVRSDQRRRNPWPGLCLTAAACLALVLGYVFQPWTEGPASTPPDSQPPIADLPAKPEIPAATPNGGELSLPEQGSEIGTLRLLSDTQADAADFLIYVNEEQYSICEDQGLYRIRNINPLPEDFPECGLDILHLSDTSPEEAEKAAAEALRERYKDVTSEERPAVLPDSPYLRASAGMEWNSEQAELWFVNDGQMGTFVLTARYFLEAEEGMGMRFRDMVSSFRVVSLGEIVPEWMRSLYEAAGRLFPALLSNDLSSISDLLAENAEANAYGEDVWKNLTVASIDYAPDDDQDPSSATVSVKHRLNLEEGESYNYLTMNLLRRDGQWLLAWSGIEK